MTHLVAFALGIGVALLVGGVPLARKFVRGLFGGNDVYVVLTKNGQMEVYKNPNRSGVHEDKPLLMIPYEILSSSDFDTYYNICWFDAGTLFRCGHSFHRKPENAMYRNKANIAGSVMGGVLEER